MLKISFIRKSGMAALALAMTVTCGALAGCSGGSNDSADEHQGSFAESELPMDEIRAAFEADSIVEDGVASDNYLNPSPYQITSFEVTNNRSTDNGTEYEIQATIENDNYITEMTVDGLQQGSRYEFDVASSTTTPKKGIDNDPANGIENANAELLADGKTCKVEVTESSDYWFVTATNTGTYTYEFTGECWSCEKEEQLEQVEYKDLDGTYTSPAGEETTWSDFTVSNLDPKTGAFHISFTQAGFCGDYDNDMEKVDVELDAGIKPTSGSSSDGAMDNDVLYAFEAHGTTNKGDGHASMEGYVGVDKAGNKILYVNDCDIDTEFLNGITKEMAPYTTGFTDWSLLKD